MVADLHISAAARRQRRAAQWSRANSKANETRRLSRRAPGLEVELSKHHYFSDAISTTSSFDWFFLNSVCRELILIWLPRELCRFHTSARKYWLP